MYTPFGLWASRQGLGCLARQSISKITSPPDSKEGAGAQGRRRICNLAYVTGGGGVFLSFY